MLATTSLNEFQAAASTGVRTVLEKCYKHFLNLLGTAKTPSFSLRMKDMRKHGSQMNQHLILFSHFTIKNRDIPENVVQKFEKQNY